MHNWNSCLGCLEQFWEARRDWGKAEETSSAECPAADAAAASPAATTGADENKDSQDIKGASWEGEFKLSDSCKSEEHGTSNTFVPSRDSAHEVERA